MLAIIISSIEICLPLLLLVGLGVVLKRVHMISETTIKEVSKMILNLFLPINIFLNILDGNIKENFSIEFALILILIFFIVALLSTIAILLLTKQRKERSAMMQAAIRSNLALFAIPLAGQIAGNSALGLTALSASLLSAFHTFYAVGEFEYFESKSVNVGRIVFNVIKSPVVIATILGFAFVIIDIQLPDVLYTTCSYISRSVVAFSLTVIGASFNFSINKEKIKRVAYCVLTKSLFCPVIAIACSLLLKLNQVQLVAILCLFASPCATSCFAQAYVYDTDMDIVSSSLVYSYVASIVTLPLLISILKIVGLL